MDSELDRLDPDVMTITLTTGFKIEIIRMKTRQFFRMLKIITHGAGPRLLQTGMDFEAESSVFATRLATLVAMSIPDAETETLEFLDSMGQPAGLHGGIHGRQPSQLSKEENAADAALWVKYHEELFNPDPMDTFSLVEAVVRREAEDVQALGKRFAAMMKVAAKTGQDQPGTPDPVPEGNSLNVASSQEPSPGPSTFSATSTGGPTPKFSDSPSAGSGKQPKPPETEGTPSK